MAKDIIEFFEYEHLPEKLQAVKQTVRRPGPPDRSDAAVERRTNGVFAKTSRGEGLRREELAVTEKEHKMNLEVLAEAAHEVWMEGKIRDGWTFASTTDKENKQHSCLVPYAELAEADKQSDRDLVAGIPAILAKSGLTLYTNNGTGFDELTVGVV